MLPEMGLAFTWKPVDRLGRLGGPYGSRRVNGVCEAPAGTGHMPRHTRPVSPLSNADLPSAGAVVAVAAPRPEGCELLSPAKHLNGILQSLHGGEPQGCSRGIEVSKLGRQHGNTRAVTVV